MEFTYTEDTPSCYVQKIRTIYILVIILANKKPSMLPQQIRRLKLLIKVYSQAKTNAPNPLDFGRPVAYTAEVPEFIRVRILDKDENQWSQDKDPINFSVRKDQDSTTDLTKNI